MQGRGSVTVGRIDPGSAVDQEGDDVEGGEERTGRHTPLVVEDVLWLQTEIKVCLIYFHTRECYFSVTNVYSLIT